MRLNHNMNSLDIYSTYKKTLAKNYSAIGRISSGVKLNSAKDNPNKLAQSESMRIQIKSLQSAQRNIQDATSMIQTVDGSLTEVSNMLNKLKELTVSAADGTKAEDDKRIIQNEINEIINGIDQLAENSEFNGVKLIAGKNVVTNEYPEYRKLVIGSMVGEEMNIPVFNVSSKFLEDDKGNKLSDIDVVNNSQNAIDTVEQAIGKVSGIRSEFGAVQNRLESTQDNLQVNTFILEKAESNFRDTDIALEMANIAKTQILKDTSLALIAQSNQIPQEALRILERVK